MSDVASLVEPHIPALRRYAWALLRDDHAADDLVQDCLERAVRRWHLRRRDGNVRAWLFAILHNQFVSGHRQRRRRGVAVPLDDATAAAALYATAGADDPELGVVCRDVLDGLAALSEEQRAVILLVAVEDLSYDEAARVLGVPIGTVMSRLSRGRDRLRSYVDGETDPRVRLRRVK
ncbi:MAG TPA: sigma-70 family RNA polymerase sigma factor [Stellaceae bacterium]|jgi:RNA polymerase sigma-70 factor (ECF subfamily)